MDEYIQPTKRAAIAVGHSKLPKLTPAFLSVDDAARYMHERIGSKREVEYGGVIMQRLSDRLYVATEPVRDEARQFDLTKIIERDSETGALVNPQGYRLVAFLHSHPDDFKAIQRQEPKWSPTQVKAFIGFFATQDIINNWRLRKALPFAYLSGPDGALIRYESSNTKAEEQRVRWLEGKGPWTSTHDREVTQEGGYKGLAEVGSLRFVVSSAVWGGSVGDVPSDWQPYKTFKAPVLPLACGPVFADVQQALSYAWRRIQRQPAVRQRALILQLNGSEQFCACEPEKVEGLATTLPQLPNGCHLHGIYSHARPLPANYPEYEAWLYKNFISPLELAQHIAQFRQYSLGPQSTLGVSLYIHMRDEAVLRYRFSGSALESQLFIEDEDGVVRDNGIQATLQDGSLLTRGFVALVAAAGELSVEKTSALWDRPGVVDEHWVPYSTVPLLTLSPAFLSADDAARYAHTRIGTLREQEMGGLILQRRDGRFAITEPAPTGARPSRLPGGARWIARINRSSSPQTIACTAATARGWRCRSPTPATPQGINGPAKAPNSTARCSMPRTSPTCWPRSVWVIFPAPKTA
jgi:hypothetical protein